MSALKIISGGQTGVDRATLDAALQNGVECGGWCPEGRSAEDGIIPLPHPLSELKGADYKARIRQNVIDSDGTLFGGTKQTLRFCLHLKKPYLLIDATELSPEHTAKQVHQFITEGSILILNATGPRASGSALAYAYTLKVITCFLKSYLTM